EVRVERREGAAGEIECGGRDVHQMHGQMVRSRAAGGDERRELVAAPRAELDDGGQRVEAGEYLAAVALKQRALDFRDAVPRQLADGLEQRGAERIVEIARRQLPGRQ